MDIAEEPKTLGQFLIISRKQAEHMLANIHADMIFSDRSEIVNGLLDGTLKNRIFDFSSLNIADLISAMDMVTDMLFDEYDTANGILLYDEDSGQLAVVKIENCGDIAKIVKVNGLGHWVNELSEYDPEEKKKNKKAKSSKK